MVSWAILLVSLLQLARGVEQVTCNGREERNATWGIISDGKGTYDSSVHCEWLITADGPGKYIQLHFVSMQTECSYDHLFVYDGNSYDDRILGSFSGETLPDDIIAESGHMLIHFYSDRNYMLHGFHAFYNVTDCPYNCSGHGHCQRSTHTCACYTGFRGIGCEMESCPDLCGRHGSCVANRCVCKDGYAGEGCRLRLYKQPHQSAWYEMSSHHRGFQARAGHAGVFIDSVNCLYVFGGNTLNTFLDELTRFCFSTNTWQVLPRTEPWPAARHGHAMATVLGKIFMFGGILLDGTHDNHLWCYHVKSKRWSVLADDSAVQPLGVTSHTLTVVNDLWLYLFGGRTQQGHFLADMYRIDVRAPSSRWHRVMARGGKVAERRLVGHSAVYHQQSNSILVFGGFLPDYAKFPKRTSALHAFHVDDNYWSQLNYDPRNVPKDRAFHTAAILGNYMLIHGGNAHIHHDEEVCYDGQLYFYHLQCHTWVDYTNMEEVFPAIKNIQHKGRFSHVTAVAFGNTLLVSGGYRGNVLDDLLAYTVPLSIAMNKNDTTYLLNTDHCDDHLTKQTCTSDPECIWCTERPAVTPDRCMHRQNKQDCKGYFKSGKCPGVCSVLHTCGACAIHGSTENCAWCVKEAQCQRYDEWHGACNVTVTGEPVVQGWWKGTSLRLNSLDQCRTHNKLAGLHWIKYRHPVNWTYPDEVSIIRSSNVSVQFEQFDEEKSVGDTYRTMMKGFVHPLNEQTSNGQPLQLQLATTAAHVQLYVSTDDNPRNKELVAELQTQVTERKRARRTDGRPIFINEARGYKYYIEQLSVDVIASPDRSLSDLKMEVEWNGALKNTNLKQQPFSYEYLEPFSRGMCQNYTNCMACLTDMSCGWCTASKSCDARVPNSILHGRVRPAERACQLGIATGPHLVLEPDECEICADNIDCQTCTQNVLCEWLTREARCLRRGRFSASVHNVSQCPIPCLQRTNCSWCLSERNECAWCETRAACFPFVEYVLRYAYGGCTQWLDGLSTQSCPECSRRHTCRDCLTQHRCGWCAAAHNPTIGLCLHGDYTQSDAPGGCAYHLSQMTNETTNVAIWSYGVCPDVQECLLGLHDCHENATCHNTPQSFECVCNRGFKGDGRRHCDRTCYYDCVHGVCSGEPHFHCQCDVGWMDAGCSTDCGCHGHSTCSLGIGRCDGCQDWTMGSHCQYCSPGSYGNATSSQGCFPCDCNGHADEKEGFCDSETGLCYCKDDTHGEHCEMCKPDFYGNPVSGGHCYLKCDGRTILTNVTSGALGSHTGLGVSEAHAYCLWIITPLPSLSGHRMTNVPAITFTMHPDINIDCTKDFVYVYDGLPDFLTNKPLSATLLAAFCGYNLQKAVSVQAVSGFLTVYFESNLLTDSELEGFNASFSIRGCPNRCDGNHTCQNGLCVCKAEYTGMNCEQEKCPHNCSAHQAQGVCNQALGRCVCEPGFSGASCSLKDKSWQLTELAVNSDTATRMAHTLVNCGDDVAYLFGGYSINRGALNDLWQFNVTTNHWKELVTRRRPPARYHHAAVCVPGMHSIYVFGGVSDQLKARNDLWKYNVQTGNWTKVQVVMPNGQPIPLLAGHTMTLIDSSIIWLIGGFSSQYYFSNKVYAYDCLENVWTVVPLTGTAPTGVYAHSSVYQKNTHYIYVFGGFEYQATKFDASSNLYRISVKDNKWNLIPQPHNSLVMTRYFHTAVSTDRYMLVLGGRTAHAQFDTHAAIYKYDCNDWMHFPVIGTVNMDAVLISGHVYMVGGFSGIMHGRVSRLTLPIDPCRILTDPEDCVQTAGCVVCSVEDSSDVHCYSIGEEKPPGCLIANTTVSLRAGQSCDHLDTYECGSYTSCGQCLSSWSTRHKRTKSCKWCNNCNERQCVHIDEECVHDEGCTRAELAVVFEARMCRDQLCQAADCESCVNPQCAWSRNLDLVSDVQLLASWLCISLHRDFVVSRTVAGCPQRCYSHSTCESCLDSPGGEGGAFWCMWSKQLQQCLPPASLPLLCSAAQCGPLVTGSPSQCVRDCSVYTRCSHCLAAPGCGWCAMTGLNGRGVCLHGGLHAPTSGHCQPSSGIPDLASNWSGVASAVPHWSFGQCPAEDECLNDHHDCRDNEECVDLAVGFGCRCKQGYKWNEISASCTPVCQQGCATHSSCVEPNVCACHFGYVGDNCSTACRCNQHSECSSVNELDTCLKCHNHTQGKQCEECQPLYVGDPKNGGECVPCFELCHHHSAVCLSRHQFNMTLNHYKLPLHPQNITRWLQHGSRSAADTVCLRCQNNTEEDHCTKCKRGFFRLKKKQNQHLTQACQPCECNGHSDMCNADTGTGCDCHNHTKSPRCEEAAQHSNQPCWQLQCSQCMDNFVGTPTDRHHCYRQMTVDRDYCFDPNTQMKCDSLYPPPKPLQKGHAVFFAIQPKYLNVDIRIVLDVSAGALDVYFSPLDDTYQVLVDEKTGSHKISVDQKYRVYCDRDSDFMSACRRDLMPPVMERQKRDAEDNSSDPTHFIYSGEVVQAGDQLNTFVTLRQPHSFLVVRNVSHRLVLILPNNVHKLKVSRFYLVLHGVGAGANSTSHGNLFFRQDQPRIDLFVFFSVFFSCFFLFLAVCVVLWKLKQAVDTHRSQHHRQLQMKSMASRPFSSVLVLLPAGASALCVNPLALEPTRNGVGVIATVFMQLPGDRRLAVNACLGSALVSMKHQTAAVHTSKASLRRIHTTAT